MTDWPRPAELRVVKAVYGSGELECRRKGLKDFPRFVPSLLLAVEIWLNNHWLHGRLDSRIYRALQRRRGRFTRPRD